MTTTGPGEHHHTLATELVTAVVAKDASLILDLTDRLDLNDARWVAVSIASLVGAYVDNEAEAQGRTPLDVWAEALAMDAMNPPRPEGT